MPVPPSGACAACRVPVLAEVPVHEVYARDVGDKMAIACTTNR